MQKVMIIRRFYRYRLAGWSHRLHTSSNKEKKVQMKIVEPSDLLCKHFNISESEAKFMCIKHPVIKKVDEHGIQCLINTLHDLGYQREVLIEEPLIFSMLPITLKYRFNVLQECGIEGISALHLVSYLNIMKRKTIRELKETGELQVAASVENRLANCMTQWPTSITTLIYGDVDNFTLYAVRLKIIQRYLELVLDMTDEEFKRGMTTYPTIKHRPLKVINEVLTILQSQIMMPSHKIKNNLYLVHADPENLKRIVYNLRSIGGIDIKEILRKHPKIAMKNYGTLIETKNVMNEYDIDNETQRRCFEIYTLGANTIRERLDKAKSIPEFATFLKHPRFLRMIYYNTKAKKRLMDLNINNKKCLSLNILSGCSAHFETFEKAPGDRLGKGKDLVFCISQCLSKHSMQDIRKVINRHPFWINIPLVQVRYVYQKLSSEFSSNDIYDNCPILLYPWNKIKEVLQLFKLKPKHNKYTVYQELLQLDKLNKSQKLSLILYILEKNHYFSGNGVWAEEKIRTSIDLDKEMAKNCK